MTILLVDDHIPTREAVFSLIVAQPDLTVVGQAATGEEGVRIARQLHPDIIVMDVVMPGMNGIEATRALVAEDPHVRILVLSNHTGRNLVKAVIGAGAAGYVRKDQAFEELVPAIRRVAAGKQYLSASAGG